MRLLNTALNAVLADTDIVARMEADGVRVYSDAVRLFLRRVVIDQTFPLELKVPNAQTRAAMAESCAIMATRRARFAFADELKFRKT